VGGATFGLVAFAPCLHGEAGRALPYDLMAAQHSAYNQVMSS